MKIWSQDPLRRWEEQSISDQDQKRCHDHTSKEITLFWEAEENEKDLERQKASKKEVGHR